LKDVCAFGEIVEDYRYLNWLYSTLATFCDDLALLVDDFAKLVHRTDLENERFLGLIAELLDKFDERLVLVVESDRRAKKKNALK
jgi:hypothetical protein